MTRILLLGGTTEASRLAEALAEAGLDTVFSYAGRTARPVTQPLPLRVGGFGGIDGLEAYLRDEGVTHVVDASHSFAAQMSSNAAQACSQAGVRLCALERPPWQAGPGDHWIHVDGLEEAVAALPDQGARVFLAIGKQNIAAFSGKPGNHYLLRLVDPPEAPLPLPDKTVEIARGPFDVAGDRALMQAHGITHIVSKNAGGSGAEAKLQAARDLGLPVIMLARPKVPQRLTFGTVPAVMAWLYGRPDHGAEPSA
ncbi:cobalt-precorrin-6A reductase [Phaeobacter gallaeciensis]|uniref:cobalt-precorrin-6A reductase n=1 Tax=Phaeobacter gallaeciensis TaxID=60890 RepID=UPI00237F2283|nr:cobalt-precorrin-6A reductase [Phaeobacter gallaeciensis]MDE4062162.1 cobalt-precorrin-6A reductase [Phaeobacter gallaeciensis]MDE4125686.1 cobalt-precorrin-6A reductase [Phaeobacter gallaeciensis]MDE4129655.1 cobalt-precorrin-6A reductase [Phaeobacter gallaeciensis]